LNLRLFVTVRGVTEEMEPFDRHTPYWLHHFKWGRLGDGTPYEGGLTVVTQPDCQAKTVFPTISLGLSGKEGRSSIDRLTQQFRAVLKAHPEADWFFYNEYDSFCLMPELPPAILHAGGIWSNVVKNTQEHFHAPEYLNLPMLLDKDSMELLCNRFDRLGFDEELGVFDRWLTQLANNEGIPWHPFGPLGYTTDRITEQNAYETAMALQGGAAFIHGVKDLYGLALVQKYSNTNRI
jgi:hypothetical protein